MTSQSSVTVDVRLLYTDEEFLKMVKLKLRALYDCIWEKGILSTDALIIAIKVCMRLFWNESTVGGGMDNGGVTVFDGEKTMDPEVAFGVIKERIVPLLGPFVGKALSGEIKNIAAGTLAELVGDVQSWFREPATTDVHLPVVTVGPEHAILSMKRLLLKL